MKSLISLCFLFLSSQTLAFPPSIFVPPTAVKLPRLGADKATVTASGLSSGAFMAVQLGVAYSDQIHGVASIAGGIYNCALGKSGTATDLFIKTPDKINVPSYVKNVEESFQKGLIADPRNLAQQKVFILNGSADNVVMPVAGKKLAEFYQAFNVQPEVDFNLKMGHAFPSNLGKNACDKSQFPWINKCDYEAPEKIFNIMYGSMNRPAANARPQALAGELVVFDQKEFHSQEAKMLDYGHVFIPKECKAPGSQCRLHIAFHGCMQSPNIIQDQFVAGANYNAWADVNKIIVLYPATTMGPGNSSGCWDWFGYTNADYAVKKSVQMTAVMKMVEVLTAQ
jgi:predicted esterase